jgi:GxxExxY protein
MTGHPNPFTHDIIGCAMKIHSRFGPGLLESAYEACLAYELEKMGYRVKPVPLVYEAVRLECGFRADIVVENLVVVECKSKEQLHPVGTSQVLSHLRLLGLPIGLLINFHVERLKDGIVRLVNDYKEKPLTAEAAEAT